jgi:hypothetical protein
MRQQAFDRLDVRGTDHASAAQAAFLLLRFLGQNMTVEGVAALKAARGGFLETLRRAPVGFQLGHGLAPFLPPLQGTLHVTLLKRPQAALYGSVSLLFTASFRGDRILGSDGYFFKLFIPVGAGNAGDFFTTERSNNRWQGQLPHGWLSRAPTF